jgi:LSD1 subclass zinc finger protein
MNVNCYGCGSVGQLKEGAKEFLCIHCNSVWAVDGAYRVKDGVTRRFTHARQWKIGMGPVEQKEVSIRAKSSCI